MIRGIASRTRFLRGRRRRRLGRPVPWPVLSLIGFTLLVAVGSVLLTLPFATTDGSGASVADATFTAVSAVTVTGLTTVDTRDHWNRAGQGVVLGLIQLGGFGFMTATTFLLALLGFRIGIRGRALARDDLSLPGLGNVRRFILSIALFTFLAEGIGFALLYAHFIREASPADAAWRSGFHAVSAFNNAGFDILGGGQSFMPLHANHYVLLVVAGLVIVGGISFAVVSNVVSTRGPRRLSLNSKIVLAVTALLLMVGTALILGAESGNPDTLERLPWTEKLSNAFFLSSMARTAGFSTLPIAALAQSTLFLLIILMFIGTAAGSAGGGIKVNTFGVLLASAMSSLRGRNDIEAFGRRIPNDQLRTALALAFVALAFVGAAAMALVALDDIRFIYGLFLVVSSFATVGLASLDVAALSPGSKILLMAVMFGGKVGVPLLVVLLTRSGRESLFGYPEERVNVA